MLRLWAEENHKHLRLLQQLLSGDNRWCPRIPFIRNKHDANVIPQKSIAVLPFENLSAHPDNAYFGVGIQEEILTRLASIAEIKVIFPRFDPALSEQTSHSR